MGSAASPPGESTWAEPPPERMPTSAWAPMRRWSGGGGFERQDAAGVLQEHDALFGDVLGVVASAEGIDYGADGGFVDDACGEHAAQDAVDHVIEACLGDLAVFDGFLQRGAEVVVVAGHLLIEAGEGGFDGAVGCAPVGDDPALELEVFLEDLVEEVVVLAGVVAVDEVVGAHDGGGSAMPMAISKARRSDSRMAFLSSRALTMLRPVS